MIRKARCAVLVLVALILSGCGWDTNPQLPREGITLSWKVCGYKIYKEVFYRYTCERGIPCVKVCIHEDEQDTRCTYTDRSGYFKIDGVTKNAEVILTFQKGGCLPRLVPVQTGTRNISETSTDPISEPISDSIIFPPMIVYYESTYESNTACLEDDFVTPATPFSRGSIAAIAMEFKFDIVKNEEEIVGPVKDTRVSIFSNRYERSFEIMYTDKYGKIYADREDESIDDGYVLIDGLEKGDYFVDFHVPKQYYCLVADILADRLVWGFRTEEPNQTRVPVKNGYRTITSIKCYNTSDGGITGE